MSYTQINRSSPVIIVGAGIFGLSTALHLTQRGYSNVTIFDHQPYHESLYSYNAGCDGASSDINKILRAAYGTQLEYQTLALRAMQQWELWNVEISDGADLPPGMTAADVLFVRNGLLSMSDGPALSHFEKATISNMKAVNKANTQMNLGNRDDVAYAQSQGFGYAVNPFRREANYGLLDISAGVVYADKACRFVLHKIMRLGVKTVFSAESGKCCGFLGDTGHVSGIVTADGKEHLSALTIMACGGWTPGIIPELDGLCETTAGSVATFRVPQTSKLWERLSVDQFPVWTYKIRDGKDGGLYGFPRDESGVVKVGYRGMKYTNPQLQGDGAVRSIPVTRWTTNSTRKLPLPAAERIRRTVHHLIPEILPYYDKSRLCWYTDTFDNHFVIDFVPNKSGLMIASGGSGHGFKFLPVIGSFVVDRVEGKVGGELDLWGWRKPGPGQETYNRLMEGFNSSVALERQPLTADDSLQGATAKL